ncbi:t-cell activation rho gtpase-activating hypothetical protein [Limosa lapponica baueri]|uniref:Rho-GAP domain-containing protein n=1 Tax=Limosa lapponica baueri TaxID=1758121 RepID=A0A2I0UDF1_LIMLA|nr:t-cell activation rho gtpase-activating hypothetical protein [Limosa lapponica baueri]
MYQRGTSLCSSKKNERVTSKLPKANFLLLNQLLFVLQNISRNAATSRMTAHNLAICVGPNVLSPPEEDMLPLDALAQVTQKVTQLVEFLIEHCGELFEEEVADLARASGEDLSAPQVIDLRSYRSSVWKQKETGRGGWRSSRDSL